MLVKFTYNMFYSLTKRDSTENATQCSFEDEYNEDPKHNQINEEDEPSSLSSSSLTNGGYYNSHGLISEDNEDSASISSVDTCHQYNCRSYTCCENESCMEEAISLKWCPNETRSQSSQVPSVHSPFEEPSEFKIKDLTNYLGMKDGFSSSITDQVLLNK